MTLFRAPDGEGARAVLAAVAEVWWRGQSLVMLAGCRPVVEVFLTGAPLAHDASRPRYVFGFHQDTGLYEWARRSRATVLLPSPELVDQLGDKRRLLELARSAEVVVPASSVLVADQRASDRLYEDLGADSVVVQMPENNMTGLGTYLASSRRELRGILKRLSGQSVKVAAYVKGVGVTLSGCVAPKSIYTSGTSWQLVGLPELTDTWGGHCGNQLVTAEEIGVGAEKHCAQTVQAVGRALQAQGFRGMFGVDALLTPEERLVVLEINPRVQSVTTLLNYVEVTNGLAPSPASHLLALLDREELSREVNVAQPPLSQLVITARKAGTVVRALKDGCYSWDREGTFKYIEKSQDLPPDDDEVLVWAFAREGDVRQLNARLCVAVSGRRVIDTDNTNRLNGYGRALSVALREAFEVRDD